MDSSNTETGSEQASRRTRWTIFRIAAGSALAVAPPACKFTFLTSILLPLIVIAAANKSPSAARAPRVDDFSMYAPADTTIPNFRVRAIPADLVPPFRVEQVVGLCDPDFQPGPQATFGLAVKVRATGGGNEFGIACVNTGGGIDTMVDFSDAGTLSYSGAERVDLAFEHTGNDLIAYSRAHAEEGAPAAPWQEIDRIDVTGEGADVRFLPQVEAFDFDPGAMVSFFDFDIPFNGAYPPGASTPEDRAVRNMVEATLAMADGLDELSDENADPDEVRACLTDAAEKIEASRAELTGAAKAARKKRATAEEKNIKKADKKARAAEKKTDKALALLDKKGLSKARKIDKNLQKAFASLLKSGDRVIPEDLREAIGGTTFKDFKKGN